MTVLNLESTKHIILSSLFYKPLNSLLELTIWRNNYINKWMLNNISQSMRLNKCNVYYTNDSCKVMNLFNKVIISHYVLFMD